MARPRLLERLEGCLLPGRSLTLFSAPAGYGKSVLASSWARRLAERAPAPRVAWLSLDADDNDPARFWPDVASAFQCQDGRLGREALALAGAPGVFPQERFLTSLLNDLAGSDADWVLVLDDYHLVAEAAIHRALAHLIERLPARCHLLILSRSDPPLPIGLLRGHDQLLEVRQDELCFRDEEAGAFLADCLGLRLTEGEVRLLNAKTEGLGHRPAAGRRLAARTPRQHRVHPKFHGHSPVYP